MYEVFIELWELEPSVGFQTSVLLFVLSLVSFSPSLVRFGPSFLAGRGVPDNYTIVLYKCENLIIQWSLITKPPESHLWTREVSSRHTLFFQSVVRGSCTRAEPAPPTLHHVSFVVSRMSPVRAHASGCRLMSPRKITTLHLCSGYFIGVRYSF
jgi:hypothetical protein